MEQFNVWLLPPVRLTMERPLHFFRDAWMGIFALREAWMRIYFPWFPWTFIFPSSGNWFSIFVVIREIYIYLRVICVTSVTLSKWRTNYRKAREWNEELESNVWSVCPS